MREYGAWKGMRKLLLLCLFLSVSCAAEEGGTLSEREKAMRSMIGKSRSLLPALKTVKKKESALSVNIKKPHLFPKQDTRVIG